MSLTRLPLLTAVLIVATTFAQAQAQAPRSSAGAVEQYRLAARYQKLEQFDLAGKEWAKLVADFPKDPLAAAGRHYAGVCQFQLGNYPAAVKWFEEFQAQHPKHELLEATLTNLGLAAYNQAQAAKGDQATELYQRVLAALDQRRSAFPEGKMAAEAEFYRGETIYALGRTTEAEAAYTKWLEQYGDSPLVPNARLALGATQSELGNTDAAVGTLNSLLKTDPPNDVAAQALVRLADAHNAANQFKQAAVYYAQALEQYPEDVDRDYVGQARASAVFSAGDFAEAANLYEDLGDLASAGKSYYQAGNHGKAADRLAKAFEASSSDADLAHWWVRSLLDGGQPAEALTAAEKALETVESPALLLDQADAMYAIDAKRSASVSAYVAAAEAAEGELAAEARQLAAATALEVGDFAAAKQQAQQVIETYAGTRFANDAKVTLAEAQLQAGEASQAASTFASLLEGADDAQRGDLLVRLAWAQSTAGDEAAVVGTLEPMIDSLEGANREQAEFLLGRAYFRTGNHAAAVAALQAVAGQDPPVQWTPEAQLVLARALGSTGDSAAGEALLNKLIKSSPPDTLTAQAYYRRAEMLEVNLKLDGSISDYEKVVARWPEHPLAPYAQYRASILRMKKQDFLEAAAGFGELIAEYPEHALATEARLAQATCLERGGKPEEAVAALDKMDANDPRVALARGTTLAAAEKWDEAIESLRTAAEVEGDFIDRDRAWYELAWAYREADKQDEARAAFETLIEVLPDSPLAADAQFRIGESYYEAGDFEDATKAFQAAISHAPAGTPLHEKGLHLLGWSLHKDGQNAEAAAAFRQQLDAHPDQPLAADAKWMIGETLFADKQYEDALAAYGTAAAAKPTSESLAALGGLHAGQAAGQLDEWQAAADWLRRATEEYPDYEGRSEIDCELGWALSKLGKPDEAMPLLVKVADRDTSPVGARARFVVGELQFADKQYEEAVRSFFKVAYGYGDREAPEAYHAWQSESLFEAARCLEQLDRSEAAAKLYAEQIERFPKESKADLAKKRLAELRE